MAFTPSRARCCCLKLASARSRASFELFAKVASLRAMADQATQGAIEHDRSSMARFDPQNGELTTISSPDCWVNLCRFEGILRVCSATIGRLKVDWTAGRRGRS